MPCKVEAVLDLLVPLVPASNDRRRKTRDKARRVIEHIAGGEDTAGLAEEAGDLYEHLPARETAGPYFAQLCCEAMPAGRLVRGKVLVRAWVDRTPTSCFSALSQVGHSPDKILQWFRDAAPETLMYDKERASLAKLPDPVQVFRGASCATIAKAAVGISWTLNRSVAENFADLAGAKLGHPGLLVTGAVPRSAVLAYIQWSQEEELIVDWRQVLEIAELPILPHSERDAPIISRVFN